MIEGVVNADLEATLTLTVQGTFGPPRQIEAVIDTGYSGFLALKPELVDELGLPFVDWGEGSLANGQPNIHPIHEATVHWDGQALVREVDILGPYALVGTELLRNHDLHVELEPGGRVLVEARAGGVRRE